MHTLGRFLAIASMYGLVAIGRSASAQGVAPAWRAAEQWRVDGTDAGDGFGDARAMVVLPDGALWVLDFKDQHIRRYDARGKALLTIARRGSGPGELRDANGMLVHRDGTVWVNDPSNGRLTVFGGNGEFVRQHSLNISRFGWHWDVWLDRRTADVLNPISVPVGTTFEHRWRRVSASGALGAEHLIPKCGTVNSEYWRAETKGKRSTTRTYPFATGGGLAADGAGAVWCAKAASRRVALVRLGSNDTIASTTVNVPTVPVSTSERDSAIAQSVKVASEYATNNFDPAKVPRAQPGIAALVVDADGRLWVQHTAKSDARSTTYDIHSATGAHLGRLTVPVNAGPYLPSLVARGNDLWLAVTDADDVVSIVRYRIQR